jgi:prefoldin subunit 5/septum formation topological specificity factor MinE
MKTTQEALQGIVNYKKISTIPVLDKPSIKKEEIPNYILCTHFKKAKEKLERTMEGYNRKVDNLKLKLQQLESDIQYMEKEHKKWHSKASTFMLDRSNVREVEKQNIAAENANRLLNKISVARDKYSDTVETHNEAIQEAEEKLQELTDEALVAIDEDIVAVIDKCTKIASKLSGSQNSKDQITALEVSFIEMKVHHFFEDFIEENTARKDARDRIKEGEQLFSELCSNSDVQNHIADLFRKNIFLIEKNHEKYGQINQAINTIDKKEMDKKIQELQNVFNENFKTNFDFENIIDPSELEKLIAKINETIDSINKNILRANECEKSSKSLAEKIIGTHGNIKAILGSMRDNLQNIENDLILSGFFEIEMLNESVIDDFYSKELKSPVKEFREFLVKQPDLDEETLDRLIMSDGDNYSIQKSESAINEADLLRLQNERNKIKEHVDKMNNLIQSLKKDIKNIEGVPKEKSEALKSEYSLKSILSCIPFIGIIFSFHILKKIKIFEAAFRSTNQIYKDLGKTLLSKNKSRLIINLIVGLVLSIGSLVAFLTVENNLSAALQWSLPVALLVIYLLTTGLLFLTGKKLGSYLGITK